MAAVFLCTLVFWRTPKGVAEEAFLPPPAIVATSAMVIDAQTGRSLYEKNADEKRAVASTQKLLTALVVSESGELEQPVEVERTDLRVVPTRVGLKVGREYGRGLLLRALLVKSGNDVARCLARDHAGGQDEFRSVMNARARELGMGNSHFVNAHGLTEDGQHSTARDMAKLSCVAYRNAVIRDAVATKKLSFSHQGWSETLKNTNRLLHGLSFVNGMKTGYTDAAGRCLVCSAAYQDREAIAVVLGSDSRNVWDDAERLLRWTLKVPEGYTGEADADSSDAGEDESEE